MIYTSKSSNEKKDSVEEESEEKEFVHNQREDKKHLQLVKAEADKRVNEHEEMEEAIINEQEVKKSTRRGKRNWSPSYIVRVFDWCVARRTESDIGMRALSRLASQF